MSQIKQSPTPRNSIGTRVPRALAFCLGLGGADLALLNVWVIPGLLTSTDISSSRTSSSEVAAAAVNKPLVAKTAVAPPAARPKPVVLQPPAPIPPPANVVPQLEAAVDVPPRVEPIVPAQPTEQDWQTATRSLVPFSLGTAAIGQEGREAVTALFDEARDGEYFVLVAGHADPPGTDRFNKRLSEQRAQAVADLLIEAGMARSRIRMRGYGEAHPSTDGHDRRVEIRFGGGR
jgi:outer membrane protein OmpA-like peptidoglycan-associated protein